MVLLLRVWPHDQHGQNAGPQLAHTVDISPIEERLGDCALRCRTVKRSNHHAAADQPGSVRVVWTKQVRPVAIQVGIESVAFEEKVWGIDLPDEPRFRASSCTLHYLAIPTAQRMNPRMSWIAVASSPLLAISVLPLVVHWILKNVGQLQ
jgi:hypothetical protein